MFNKNIEHKMHYFTSIVLVLLLHFMILRVHGL